MARVVTLAEVSPPLRYDGVPWEMARIEGADEVGGSYETVSTITVEAPDADPAHPAVRGFTVATEKAWVRVVWLDGEGNESEPSPVGATSGPPWRPVAADVAAALRARTYATPADEPEDGGDPMNVIAGSLLGEFSERTRPSAEEVEASLIPAAVRDVARGVGRVPWDLLDDARRVATLAVVCEIERSYLPEQATPDGSMYQAALAAYQGELQSLRRRLQWWVLTRRMEAA